jgi:cysteine-rich repeat protein
LAFHTANDYAPHVATDGAGAWVAVWSRAGNEPAALVARSVDDGVTWTLPQKLNVNAVPGDERGDVDPQVATDRAGSWVAVWSSSDSLGGTSGNDGNTLMTRSTDDGTTWTAPVPLNTDAHDHACDYHEDFSPQLGTDRRGTWVALWSRAATGCPGPVARPDVELFAAHNVVCGDGVLERDETCDDGNTLAGDGCAPDCRFEPCRALPASGCRATGSANASLKVTNHVSRQLEWKWGRGIADRAEFGDPTRSGDDYHLCVYDAGRLVSSTAIPAGGICGARPCWDATAAGFEFREKLRRPKSALRLLLKASAPGKSRLHFRARDAAVHMPTLPASGPLVVQLQRVADPQCWEARFSAPFLRNDAAGLFGRSD